MVKLPAASLRKLFRDHFPGNAPMVFGSLSRPRLVTTLRDRIARIDGVELTDHPGDRDVRSKALCRFLIPNPHQAGYYFRSNELRLELDDDRRLQIAMRLVLADDLVAPVSEWSEIDAFVRDVLRRYARRKAAHKKREKIRDWKVQAILAQINQLADSQQFDFTTNHDTQKLELFVQLSGDHSLQVTIPLNDYQTALVELQQNLAMIRALYARGLRFSIVPKRKR